MRGFQPPRVDTRRCRTAAVQRPLMGCPALILLGTSAHPSLS